MDKWQVITEQHESQITAYWMAVCGSRVQWRGVGSYASIIAPAIVSLFEYTDTTKVLMADHYQETVATLRRYRDSGLMPKLPYVVLEAIAESEGT